MVTFGQKKSKNFRKIAFISRKNCDGNAASDCTEVLRIVYEYFHGGVGGACPAVARFGEIVSKEELRKRQTLATHRPEETLSDVVV